MTNVLVDCDHRARHWLWDGMMHDLVAAQEVAVWEDQSVRRRRRLRLETIMKHLVIKIGLHPRTS